MMTERHAFAPVRILVLSLFIFGGLLLGLRLWSGGSKASAGEDLSEAQQVSSADAPAATDSQEEESTRRTLLLKDLLSREGIQSPLLELEAASELADLADPALDTLLDEGFEDFEWELEGWPRVSWARVEEDELAAGEPGKVLHLEGISRAAGLGWVLPVHRDAIYHFERKVRVQGSPFCDLYVMESRLEVDEARLDPQRYFLAGRGDTLKVHSLPLESGEHLREVWQHASLSFQPTPRTRSLVVLFRARVGADARASLLSMDFDDVRLQEVLPSSKERIRLMKGAHLARGADPELGLQKAGLLLPLPTPTGAQEGEADELNYNWREALYAPPMTELSFKLKVPEGARLRLATGLARETPLRSAARFQVELTGKSGGDPSLLMDEVRVAQMEEWGWEEASLDLSRWGGQEIRLLLRTLSEKGDPHPLWANARVEAAPQAEDPLVILIAVDTLRADRLGTYGYERDTSPALDRLATDGVRFDQARSNCNWTCPSFASIFTGLVPSRHGVTSYGPATPLPEELVTLAEYFQGEGWSTHSIAYKVPLFDGNYEQGFDQAFNVPRDVIQGEENLARALEWLESHRGGPAFLFLHFNDPHQPFVQPEPFDRAFGPSASELGYPEPISIPGPGQEEAQRLSSDLYDGAIAYVDDCIGSFLDALRERDLYQGATIAFVADHGEQFWEHGRFGHGGADLYDEVVRVPLIVKPAEGSFEAGRVVQAEVSAFDVMPTLLELSGIEPSRPLDALSLVPLIQGTLQELGRPVVTETSDRGLCLVQGGFKFVLEPGGAEEALYDLRADPLEQAEISQDQPAELARLRGLAIAYLLEHRPGNYMIVHGAGDPVELLLSTRAVRGLVGPSLRLEPERDGQTRVSLAANAWALLEIEDPAASEVELQGLGARGSETEFGPWIAGAFPSLSGAGVWRIRGPEPRVESHDSDEEPEPEVVDEEMMDALRRLGYAE